MTSVKGGATSPRLGAGAAALAAQAATSSVRPEHMVIPADQRTAFSYETLARSYDGSDGQRFPDGWSGHVLSADEAVMKVAMSNPQAIQYMQLVEMQKSYQSLRSQYQTGGATQFQRSLASTNLGTGYEDGTALATLNLDATMTSVLFEQQHLVLWNWLNRVPSINTLYQWTERTGYGSQRGGIGFAQGGVPATGLAAWTRNQAQVCFFGVRRGITDVEAQAGLLGGLMVDPVQEEDKDGAFQLLGRAETNFLWGDPAVTDDNGNVVNYPGIFVQMTDTTGNYAKGNAPFGFNVYDLQGRYLNFTDLNSYAATLYQAGKLSTFVNLRMFLTPQTLEDLSNLRQFVDRRAMADRIPDGPEGYGYVTGAPIPGHATNFGFIPFTASIFLFEVPNGQAITSGPPEQGAPPVPTLAGSAGAPAGGVTSHFVASNGLGQSDAGTYYYWAASVNDEGESFASGTTTNGDGTFASNTSGVAVAVAVGQVVTLTITPGTSNGAKTTQYRLYRGVVNDLTDSATTIIGHVAVSPNNLPASTSFVDNNSQRSGTSVALILDRTPVNMCVAQMAPLTKYPLAIVQTKVEWLLLLYHVLVVKARQRQILIRNIGRFSPAI